MTTDTMLREEALTQALRAVINAMERRSYGWLVSGPRAMDDAVEQALEALAMESSRPAQGLGREEMAKELIAHGSFSILGEECNWQNALACADAILRLGGREEGPKETPPPFAEGAYGDRLCMAAAAYLEEYVFSLEDGPDHEPTEFERWMLEDFFNGLISEESFFGIVRALADGRPLPAPPATGETGEG